MKIIELAKEKSYKPNFNKELFTDKEKIMEFALLISWIRENFGIICTHTMPTKINNKWLFGGKVFSMENEADNMVIGAFNSPEQAVEAALLHTLKNLIP